MNDQQRNTFCSLVVSYLEKDLRRIAGATRGELEVDDLASEAFLTAHELCAESEAPTAPDDPAFHQSLLARLYNRTVKWTDPHFKRDLRIDQASVGSDGNDAPSAVARSLASSTESDPLEHALQVESQLDIDSFVDGRYAEAVGYAHAFGNSGHGRRDMANHLGISLITLWRRCRNAEAVAAVQPSLFDGISPVPRETFPRGSMLMPRLGHYRTSDIWLNHVMLSLQRRLFVRAFIPIRVVE